jgi:hypothetical protein
MFYNRLSDAASDTDDRLQSEATEMRPYARQVRQDVLEVFTALIGHTY